MDVPVGSGQVGFEEARNTTDPGSGYYYYYYYFMKDEYYWNETQFT